MVTCMLIASFRSHHLPSAFFFSSKIVAYVCRFPSQQRVRKRTHQRLKLCHIFAKNILLKLNFKDEGHVDANFLIYILTIYREFLRFQFFSRVIRMHTLTLTVVQNTPISLWKNSHILLKQILFSKHFFSRSISNVCQFFVLYFLVLP